MLEMGMDPAKGQDHGGWILVGSKDDADRLRRVLAKAYETAPNDVRHLIWLTYAPNDREKEVSPI